MQSECQCACAYSRAGVERKGKPRTVPGELATKSSESSPKLSLCSEMQDTIQGPGAAQPACTGKVQSTESKQQSQGKGRQDGRPRIGAIAPAACTGRPCARKKSRAYGSPPIRTPASRRPALIDGVKTTKPTTASLSMVLRLISFFRPINASKIKATAASYRTDINMCMHGRPVVFPGSQNRFSKTVITSY